MAFEYEFQSMFPQTVTIEPQTGTNFNGEDSYGPSTTFSARAVDRVHLIRNFEGEQVGSNTMVWVNTVSSISTRDKITLPTGYSPSQPPILSVSRYPDSEGLHHTVIHV